MITGIMIFLFNLNAHYLAHALIRECSVSSACAILSRRG